MRPTPLRLVKKGVEAAEILTSSHVDTNEYNRRLGICLECPHLDHSPKGMYCGKCGCPKWAKSEMRTKARYLKAECPEGKW